MKKKLLVVLLTLALVFSFTAVASAADDVDVKYALTSSGTPAASVSASAGQTVYVTFTIDEGVMSDGKSYEFSIDGSVVATKAAPATGNLTYTAQWKADSAKKAWVIKEVTPASEGVAESKETFANGNFNVTVLDNTLKTLTVDGANVLSSLEAHVASAKGYVAIAGTAQSDDYKVTITPAAEASGDNAGKYAVAAAGTTFTVKVEEAATGESALGLASKTYTLKVYRDYDVAKITKAESLTVTQPTSTKNGTIKGAIDIGYGSTYVLDLDFVGKTINSGSSKVNSFIINNDGTAKVNLKSLKVGEKAELTLTVTAQDGTTTAVYDVELTPYASLAIDLALEGEDTDKDYIKQSDFSPLTEKYSVELDEDDDELELKVYWDDDTYNYKITVKYDGTTVDTAKSNDKNKSYASFKIDIDPENPKKITVKVQDEDGIADTVTYTINLDGNSLGDAVLKSLKVYDDSDAGSSDKLDLVYGFNKDVLDYYVVLPYDKDGVDVYMEAVAADKDFEVRKTISGSDISGDVTKIIDDIDGGETKTFKFYVVDDSDDAIYNEYTVTVIMAGKNDDGDEDLLDDLELHSGKTASKVKTDVDFDFKASTTKYSIVVDEDQKYLKVEADPEDSKAIVFINGKKAETDTIQLAKGKNEIEVTVYAENCDDKTTYTLTVNRGGGMGIIKTLYVQGLVSNSLSPAFDGLKLNYVGYVAPTTSSVTVYAVADSSADTIYVNGVKYENGTATATVALKDGLNVIPVFASGDGSKTSLFTYYISIYKPVAAPKVQLSSQKVTVNGTAKTLSAYNINGNNFLQLRDVAVLLDNTVDEFSVDYLNGNVILTTNANYTKNGTENAAKASFKNNGISSQPFYLDGVLVYPVAYNINGSNYVMLRDVAALLDFGVTYSSANGGTIVINTANNYTPGK